MELYGIPELAFLEYVRIIREEAEQEPRKEDVERRLGHLGIVDVVFLYRFKEMPHLGRGLDVRRVLDHLLDDFASTPGQEEFVIIGKFIKGDIDSTVTGHVLRHEPGEVSCYYEALLMSGGFDSIEVIPFYISTCTPPPRRGASA